MFLGSPMNLGFGLRLAKANAIEGRNARPKNPKSKVGPPARSIR